MIIDESMAGVNKTEKGEEALAYTTEHMKLELCTCVYLSTEEFFAGDSCYTATFSP